MTFVGQQLGNYQVKTLLGKGGFAEVYLGEHLHLGTKAAIKVLLMQVSPQEVAYFLAEARLLVALEHPHIIRVLDFGMDGFTPYLIMAYAPGGSLRQRHPKGTRLPIDLQDVGPLAKTPIKVRSPLIENQARKPCGEAHSHS